MDILRNNVVHVKVKAFASPARHAISERASARRPVPATGSSPRRPLRADGRPGRRLSAAPGRGAKTREKPLQTASCGARHGVQFGLQGADKKVS